MRLAPAVVALALALGGPALASAAQPQPAAPVVVALLEQGDAPAASAANASEAHAKEEAHPAQPWPAILVNFTLFVLILAYLLWKPTHAFFAQRKATIALSLAAAEASQADAAARLAEAEARLEGLGQQIKDILARASEQAVAEKDLILVAARTEATRLRAQAEAQVKDLEAESVRRLKATAAELSVEIAREIIEKQLKPEDRNRVFDRSLKGIQKSAT